LIEFRHSFRICATDSSFEKERFFNLFSSCLSSCETGS
jgi:hypothetical protein